jgi:hypothetical protein
MAELLPTMALASGSLVLKQGPMFTCVDQTPTRFWLELALSWPMTQSSPPENQMAATTSTNHFE